LSQPLSGSGSPSQYHQTSISKEYTVTTVCSSPKAHIRTLNDVTKICLAATTGCFLVGGLFLLADGFIPLGPRGLALIAVGCFFLAHGIFEFAKQHLSREVKEPATDSSSEPTGRTAA
jgi:hypothetical protein